MANTVTSSFACLRRPACVAPRSVLRRRALQCRHAAAHALVLFPIGQMSEALIIPSIMLRQGQKWNERYELIVRLDATAKEKESSLPVESSTRVFGRKSIAAQTSPCLALISLSSDGTRSCAQTVMSSGISTRFVDFAAFSFVIDRVRCVLEIVVSGAVRGTSVAGQPHVDPRELCCGFESFSLRQFTCYRFEFKRFFILAWILRTIESANAQMRLRPGLRL
jgi:hypothetical protein